MIRVVRYLFLFLTFVFVSFFVQPTSVGFAQDESLGSITLTVEALPDDGTTFDFEFAPPPVEFVTQWGGSGEAWGYPPPELPEDQYDGPFSTPTGVDVDSNGNVYIADYRIQKFDSNGEYLGQFDGDDNEEFFSGVTDLAFDGADALYTVSRESKIQKLDVDGTILAQWTFENDVPHEELNYTGNRIAIGSDGNVYATNYMADRIYKFDSNGNLITDWALRDEPNLEPVRITGIAVDSNNNVYAADTINYTSAVGFGGEQIG